MREADRDRRSILPERARRARAFTFVVPFSLTISMTRTHARLLGPCFKTGPASARNRIIADRNAHSPRLHGCDGRRAAPTSALWQDFDGYTTLRRAGRVKRARFTFIPSDSRPATARSVPPPASGDERAPGRRLGRHRTGRDAILREKCTPSADATDARRAHDRSRTHRRRAGAPRNNDESLRSFIRVSQVYP